MRYYYKATALDGIAVSETHANTYSASCLDYIPGSAILGALAADLYSEETLHPEELDQLFQNGSSVFSNAYPTDKGEITLPVPLCLHYPKDQPQSRDSIENKCVRSDDDSREQYKQLRSGFITPSCEISTSIRHRTITRTAIDPESQSARNRTLHTTEFISPGSVFAGFIDINCDDLAHKIDGRIRGFLNSTIRIGNGRGSEFGRIRLEFLDMTEPCLNTPVTCGNKLFLWCLSDCEFISLATGQNSPVPVFDNLWILMEQQDGKSCGAGRQEMEPAIQSGNSVTGTYKPDSSFVRNISVRHFNRTRGGLDSENLLVKKGSIICFETSRELSVGELEELQKHGIGINMQYGYGQVLINPEWLVKERKIARAGDLFTPFRIPETLTHEADEGGSTASLNPNLRHWLSMCNEAAGRKHRDKSLAQHVVTLYLDLRKYCCGAGNPQGTVIGPSKTQWKSVMEILKDHKKGKGGKGGLEACLTPLRDYLRNEVPKESQGNTQSAAGNSQKSREWGARFTSGGQFANFAEHLIRHLEQNSEAITIDSFIRQLEAISSHSLNTWRGLEKLKKETENE